MNFKWISNNKRTIKVILSLLIISLLIGVLFYVFQKNITKIALNNEIKDLLIKITTSRQNNILRHFLIISVAIVLSFTVVGFPIILLYLLYEGISLGFLISSFYYYHKINGLLFGVSFSLINKLVYFLIMIYLIINTYKYSKDIIKNIKSNKTNIIYNQLIKCFFVILIVILNDTILYFFGNKLLSVFLFLM